MAAFCLLHLAPGDAMARITRADVYDSSEIAVVHTIARTVRRRFLFGEDPTTGNIYDHRKVWIANELRLLAANMGIDLLCFSLLSNHFHLVLRSRPDIVLLWDDSEVARRWLMLCPIRRTLDGSPEEPNEPELNGIRNGPEKLKKIRTRLRRFSNGCEFVRSYGASS